MRHVRRRRRRRPARRRRVARDVRVAPAERVGLDAAGVVRPGEPRALVDVAQRRRARGRRVVLVVRRDVQPMCSGLIVFVAACPSAGRGRADRGRQVRERDLDLEVVAAGRAVAVVDGRRVAADPRRRRDDLDARSVRGLRRPSPRAGRSRSPGGCPRRAPSTAPFTPLPLEFDGSLVNGKTPSLNVCAVSSCCCEALPRGSMRISTESASQCATHSSGVTA